MTLTHKEREREGENTPDKNTWQSLKCCTSISWNFRFRNVQTYFAYHFATGSSRKSPRFLFTLVVCCCCSYNIFFACVFFFQFYPANNANTSFGWLPFSPVAPVNILWKLFAFKKEVFFLSLNFKRFSSHVIIFFCFFFFEERHFQHKIIPMHGTMAWVNVFVYVCVSVCVRCAHEQSKRTPMHKRTFISSMELCVIYDN